MNYSHFWNFYLAAKAQMSALCFWGGYLTEQMSFTYLTDIYMGISCVDALNPNLFPTLWHLSKVSFNSTYLLF